MAFDSVVSSTATSVKLSSSTSSARADKLPECSTSVLILLFVAFDSVVSTIAASVKLSSSISSSIFGKLLEFSLAEKIRTGSVGNVLGYRVVQDFCLIASEGQGSVANSLKRARWVLMKQSADLFTMRRRILQP